MYPASDPLQIIDSLTLRVKTHCALSDGEYELLFLLIFISYFIKESYDHACQKIFMIMIFLSISLY